ncbi:MAG: PD-(D/E)XK nuclease family transposase, partial [Bacteroidales bacterium]|nr:PD-(D/E)XK nuclease family transposase [Bacteroidales bacterium]
VHAVYVVCFVNFKMQHTDCPPGKIVYTYELREQETGELYGEYISLNFCELPRLAKNSFDTLNPKEQWFHLLKNMRTFALNPKGVPERMKKVLEASRTSALPGKEQLQYFRAMISDIEKEDIATANYQSGKEDHARETAQRMLADKKPMEEIVKYSGLTEEQIKAL